MKTLFLTFTTLLFTHFNALACSKTLVMGTNETNWPPYLVKQGDTFLGTEVDAVNAIFKDSKFCIKWTYFPSFSRVQAELKNGRVDITYAASYTKNVLNMRTLVCPTAKKLCIFINIKTQLM